MKPETWVAIYAAIVGTGALLLNFKTWLDSGPKLKLTLIGEGIVIGGHPRYDERDIIIVTLINRGNASTTITGLSFFEFPSWWRLWRNRPAKAFAVLSPQLKGYPPNIPSELAPAKTWTGVIRRREDLVRNIHDGTHYAAVFTTHRDRPYLKRIPKLKAKPDVTSPSPATS